MQSMYYVGMDVHKKVISYCVKDASGSIQAEGVIPATRLDLNRERRWLLRGSSWPTWWLSIGGKKISW